MTDVFDHSCDCDPPSDAIPEFDARQVPSLVRPAGYEPPPAAWRDAGSDHRVRLEDGR